MPPPSSVPLQGMPDPMSPEDDAQLISPEMLGQRPSHHMTEVSEQAARQLPIHEDEQIFDIMDRIAREVFDPPQAITQMDLDRTRTMFDAVLPIHEDIGMGIVNTRGVRRVMVPEFEIASNPTIRLEGLQARRTDRIFDGGASMRPSTAKALNIWNLFLASRFNQRVEEGPDEPSVLDM